MLSISTGTLFLMHAVISADRLTSMLKGIEEDIEREIDELVKKKTQITLYDYKIKSYLFS